MTREGHDVYWWQVRKSVKILNVLCLGRRNRIELEVSYVMKLV